MEASIQRKGTAVVVSITDQFKGQHGKDWTRARTADGNRIIAPTRLFTAIPGGKAVVNPKEISEEAEILAGVAKLRTVWKA